jgi:RNA polymerase sigma-70 factor (ECF subfamily)
MHDTDAGLLAAALTEANTGASAAFEQILLRYERLIHHICRRYFYQAEDAMDAGQESVIRVYKGLPGVKLPENGSLKGWICAVTANTCIDILRKKRITTEPMPEIETPYISGHSAEETAFARERTRCILNAITKLPEDHRMIVILRDMNGLSYQELAEGLGVNTGTVKSRLSRARAALRQLLQE